MVPAGTQVRIDGGDTEPTAWVTTTPSLQATSADRAAITPPWAQQDVGLFDDHCVLLHLASAIDDSVTWTHDRG